MRRLLWLALLAPVFAGAVTTMPADTCPRRMQKPFWERASGAWQANVRKILEEDEVVDGGSRPAIAPAYRAAFQDRDPRIARLSRFGFGITAEGPVTIPTLMVMVAAFRAELKEWIRTEQIQDTETLEPGVMMRGPSGYRIVRFGGAIQAGETYVDVSDNPHLFTWMVSEGVFPLSLTMRAHHDLFHAVALLESPVYMKGIRRLAQDFGRRGHPLPLRDRYVRFFWAYEAFALPNALTSTPFVRPPTVAANVARLHELSADAARAAARTAVQNANRRLQRFGGAVSEIGRRYTNVELDDTFPTLIRVLEKALDADDKDAVRLAHARLELAWAYARRMTIESLFEGIRSETFLPENPLHAWFVTSDFAPNHLLSLSLARKLTAEHEKRFSGQYQIGAP